MWPGSSLRIVEGGAHALFEKPMRSAAQAVLAQLTSKVSACGSMGSRESAAELPSKRQRS